MTMTDAKPVVVAPTDAFQLPPDLDLGAEDVAPNIPSVTVTGASTDAPFCGKDGCTNHVTKPAKGPYPKYCDDHRGTRNRTGTTTRSNNAGWANAAVVEQSLVRYMGLIGTGIGFIYPDDGTVIVKQGPDVAHELVELGKVDRRLRRYLDIIATPGKYGPLVMAVAGMVLPIMANHDLLPRFVINVTGQPDEQKG